ncbi:MULTISPECIES: hypothetical protein [unclassified Mucilaginibacter]|uniref:hypothetical protein n=1 Tax=unclassified Mucilaginibacter TaxID=2617802 RepID=UPI0031F6CFCB
MKLSKFLAKLVIRLVFILLLAAGFGIMQNTGKLQQLGYINLLQWQLIFPVLLLGGFVGLMITAAVKKFNVQELNWLLVVNAVMVIAYGVAVFIQINKVIK